MGATGCLLYCVGEMRNDANLARERGLSRWGLPDSYAPPRLPGFLATMDPSEPLLTNGVVVSSHAT